MLGKNVRRSRWRESGQKIVGRRLSQSGWTHSASPMVCRITITPTGKSSWLLIWTALRRSQQSSYLFLTEVRVVNLTCEKDFFLTFHIISEVTTSLIPSVLYRPFRLTPTKPQWGRKGDTSYSHLRGEETGAPWLALHSVSEPGSELGSPTSDLFLSPGCPVASGWAAEPLLCPT